MPKLNKDTANSKYYPTVRIQPVYGLKGLVELKLDYSNHASARGHFWADPDNLITLHDALTIVFSKCEGWKKLSRKNKQEMLRMMEAFFHNNTSDYRRMWKHIEEL